MEISYGVQYRRMSYATEKNTCLHCAKQKITRNEECAMCHGNVCYDTECRLHFDFFTGKHLCWTCVRKIDRRI